MKNKREVTPEEMRSIQLDILDKIHNYCEKNNLKYSLAGGTLLGAVRHQGFIPWDDDIDIIMPRPDYEKFMAGFNNECKELTTQYYKNDRSFFYFFGKVYNNNTVMIETDNSKTGVYVDVFPVDGMPNTIEEVNKYKQEMLDIQEQLKKTTQYFKYKKGLLVWLKYYLKLIIYPSRKKVIKRFDALINSFPLDNSEYAGVAMAIYGMKEWFKGDVFKEYIDLPFENKMRKCISKYDIYLSSLYGNYMELPPPEMRKRRHFYKAYWI